MSLPTHKTCSQDTPPDTATKTCAIEVRDIDSRISRERLTLFFGDECRSGGGEIQDLEYNLNRRLAVITFETAEGAVSLKILF